jgi:hypothetical protein
MISSNVYTRYIKDPFDKDSTMTYMNKNLPYSKKAMSKDSPLLPPYVISFKSLILDGGPLEKGVRYMDIIHSNAYLIGPRLVYHLSTELKDVSIYKCLGQEYEVKLIHFITRYGYATRPNPYCQLHGAYARYYNMHNTTYINNCDDMNRIILVTMFLVMLFNACFTYQPQKDTNLLILALDRFDYGMTLTKINKLHTKLPLILLCTIMIDDGLFDCRVLPQQGRKRGG